MDGIFNIMSNPNTSWPGVDCNTVWCVLCTKKAVASSRPINKFNNSKHIQQFTIYTPNSYDKEEEVSSKPNKEYQYHFDDNIAEKKSLVALS